MSEKPKKTRETAQCNASKDQPSATKSTVGLAQVARIYQSAGRSIVASDNKKETRITYGASCRVR